MVIKKISILFLQIKQGGMVPKELYSQPEPDIRMTAVTVKSSSTLKLEYEIHKPNSLLRLVNSLNTLNMRIPKGVTCCDKVKRVVGVAVLKFLC